MTSDWDFIVAPADVTVTIQINPTMMSLHSLMLLNIVEKFSGLSDWVYETAEKLTDEEKWVNQLVAAYSESVTYVPPQMSFPQWLTTLDQRPADEIVTDVTNWLREHEQFTSHDTVMKDEASFMSFIHMIHDIKIESDEDKEIDFDEDYWRWYYAHITDPASLKAMMINYLKKMWVNYLEPEWKRSERLMNEVARALTAIEYKGMNAFDAVEAVTGRNMRGKNGKLTDCLERSTELYFVPTTHLGPYIGWFPGGDYRTVVFFGARLPQDTKLAPTPDLNRGELLVRLNALADDTRLQILEMLTESEELCAQDFINNLNLSQSSASRHLRQLTASGFISERRRDVAKCYSLNQDRIEDTIKTIRLFLKIR